MQKKFSVFLWKHVTFDQSKSQAATLKAAEYMMSQAFPQATPSFRVCRRASLWFAMLEMFLCKALYQSFVLVFCSILVPGKFSMKSVLFDTQQQNIKWEVSKDTPGPKLSLKTQDISRHLKTLDVKLVNLGCSEALGCMNLFVHRLFGSPWPLPTEGTWKMRTTMVNSDGMAWLNGAHLDSKSISNI